MQYGEQSRDLDRAQESAESINLGLESAILPNSF